MPRADIQFSTWLGALWNSNGPGLRPAGSGAANAPQLQTVCVHSRAWHESGGSAVQELAFTLADGFGRMLMYPLEIPGGIFTSLIGAPFFLLLLRRRQHDLWQ